MKMASALESPNSRYPDAAMVDVVERETQACCGCGAETKRPPQTNHFDRERRDDQT